MKQGMREARGSGSRKRVCDNAAIHLNWMSFLRLDDNKKDLFQYLAANVAYISLSDLEIISTAAVDVISSTTVDKEDLAPCNHGEADTRIFTHAKHASCTEWHKENPHTNGGHGSGYLSDRLCTQIRSKEDVS